MATIMADLTAQNPTNTNIRAPYSTSVAPSMADSLSPLNFKFDELRACMSNFSRRFDAFIEQGRRRILEDRTQFRMSVAEVQDQHMHTARNISSLRAQSSSHASTLAAQVTETQDMQTQIASLTLTRDAHSSSVAALRVRLAAANGTLESRRATQRQQRMYIERQGARDAPEIAAWEDLLGLRIEGAGVADRVRFVFPALGDGNEEVAGSATSGRWQRDREAFFDLDMDPRAGVGYEVVECRPRLDADAVNACLRSMREREDLRGFLRGMRRLFVDEFAR